MKKILIILLSLLSTSLTAQTNYDIVVIGGNPGGIMAAVQAARLGKSTLILERTEHIGGLPVNGLGATDINTRGATTGLFGEFIERVKRHYIATYGADSQQTTLCSDGYHFEPSVAALVFEQMIGEHKRLIRVLTERQFDAEPKNLSLHDNKIDWIEVTNRQNGTTERYHGKVFIDGTYEGDLGAAAGIPFRVGREASTEFSEQGAGRIYKFWDGPTGEGSTGEGDNAVQSYNYRLCLTDNPANRLLPTKPDNYNRREYVSLIDDVLNGVTTDIRTHQISDAERTQNRLGIERGDSSKIEGDVWGIAKLTNRIFLPNAKTDANNQHLALISTDLPEENWAWPTSSWEWRDKFAKRLKEYTLGLLWFAQNDSALPPSFRNAVSQWGFAKDEYTDNGNFPRQVYVREGRRFEGSYFFTASDALPIADQRPPIHIGSITASHYALDSHAVRKRETGRVHLDGFLSYPSVPYTVPFGVMLSKEVDNLLLPVPVSGSHIGFSTLRMEPCWMALGQAAGAAASLAIDNKSKINNVEIVHLQELLLDNNATLIYFPDLAITDPCFRMCQYMGIRGYLPQWNARMNEPIDEHTLAFWSEKSGIKLESTIGSTTRSEVLKKIYDTLRKH